MENNTSTNHENGNDANRLLPAVILSLGFKIENNNPTLVYLHTKHNVRLQKMITGETSYFFQVPHKVDLESGVPVEWTGLKRVDTENEIKELFLVLWGTSL